MLRSEYIAHDEPPSLWNWLRGMMHARVGMSRVDVLGVWGALRYC